ncbi:MAG: phage holin family protein [Bacteroidota bacterium]
METPAEAVESLLENVETYVKTTFELYSLKLLQTTTNVVSSLASKLPVLLLVILFLFLLSIGMAIYLGELLGKIYFGFFIVAACYLVTGFILYLFLGKWIKKPLSEFIIKQALQ